MIRKITCTDVYLERWMAEVIVLTVAIVLTLMLCYLEAIHQENNAKKRYFKLIIPMNLLSVNGHNSMIFASFTCITIKILNVLVLDNAIRVDETSIMIKVAVTLAIVVVISLTYLPLLNCVITNNSFCNIAGILYIILYVVLGVFAITPACSLSEMSVFQITTMIEFNILLLSCGAFLIVKFVLRLLGKSYTTKDVIAKLKDERIHYVKNLLKPTNKEEKQSLEKGLPNTPRFRYSLTILLAAYTGVVLVVGVAIVYGAAFTNTFLKFNNQMDIWTDNNTEMVVPELVQAISKFILQKQMMESSDKAVEMMFNFIQTQGTCLFAAAIVGIVLAAFSALYHAHALIQAYRPFKLDLQKRKSLEKVVNIKHLTNTHLVVCASKYAGSQTAHIIWGYHVQAVTVFIVCMLLIETIILPSESLLLFFINFMKLFTPLIIFVILTTIIECILIKKYFLQDNGNILALDNRRGFFNMMYLLYFFNLFHGTFSCMNRFLKWSFTGMWFYPRLDRTILAPSLEKCDIGLLSFVALLKLEDIEDNPIVNTFITILSDSKDFNISTIPNSDKIIRGLSLRRRGLDLRKKMSARNKWFIAWTLMHNESLQSERKTRGCNINDGNVGELHRPLVV